jgi:uncharacterized protein with PIN domain
MNVILDACAAIAFFRAETGAELVGNYLLDKHHDCYIHSINACEVYYDFYRTAGADGAEAIIQELMDLGVKIQNDYQNDQFTDKLWKRAGTLKATIRRISLADCFALALAEDWEGTLLTSDHTEFDPIVHLSICNIQFIR